jgi:hypothetical protein
MTERYTEEGGTGKILAKLINRVKGGVLQTDPKIAPSKRVPVGRGGLQSGPWRGSEEGGFVERVKGSPPVARKKNVSDMAE